ncbi:hypothetical protein [Sorangium sp. So ce1099]|uniref:hypothetical protein n=1 Tax=Sorangium sp. So ce1099 TaxID=3133331 RepID=UPI003F62291A
MRLYGIHMAMVTAVLLGVSSSAQAQTSAASYTSYSGAFDYPATSTRVYSFTIEQGGYLRAYLGLSCGDCVVTMDIKDASQSTVYFSATDHGSFLQTADYWLPAGSYAAVLTNHSAAYWVEYTFRWRNLRDVLTHGEAEAMILAHGMQRNVACSDRSNSSCTSFDSIRRKTVEGIIDFKDGSTCSGIVITGGTETGHGDDPNNTTAHSHWNGYKIDVRLSTCVTDRVRQLTGHQGSFVDGTNYYDSVANKYYSEFSVNHWDIQYNY